MLVPNNALQKKLTFVKEVWFPEICKLHDYVDERITDKQLENHLQGGFVLRASEQGKVGGKSTRCYVIYTRVLEEVLYIPMGVWERGFNLLYYKLI